MRTSRRAIWAIVTKDVGVWLRQPAVIAATVMPAIVFMAIIVVSAAAVGRNPVALVVLDNRLLAARMAGIIEHSEAFVTRRETPAEAARLLTDLEVAAVVTIPADFDAKIAARRPDPVDIRINNLNLDFTNDLRRSLPAAITEFYRGQVQSPIHVMVQESDVPSQDVTLIQFELIPNLVLLLTLAGVINCGIATAREFEEFTIKELLLAPIGKSTLIAGKLVAGWSTTMLVGGIVLLLGVVTGELRPVGVFWLPTLVDIALLGAASAGLGAALGAALRKYGPVTGIGINVSLYLFFLSGGIGVAAFLPAWVQAIARFTPTFYAVHALQMAVFYQSTDQLGRDLLILIATAVAGLLLGVLSLRRRVVA